MQNNKFYRLLGLAARARGIVFGESAVQKCIKDKSARLVIVSDDASENTKKKFKNSSIFYNVRCVFLSDRFSLGKYTGRAFVVVMAITNESLADGMMENLDEE